MQRPQKEFSIADALKITGDSKGPARVHECKLGDGASGIQMHRLCTCASLHHVSVASLKVDGALGGERQGALELCWKLTED